MGTLAWTAIEDSVFDRRTVFGAAGCLRTEAQPPNAQAAKTASGRRRRTDAWRQSMA
jgi:hypothetical protein